MRRVGSRAPLTRCLEIDAAAERIAAAVPKTRDYFECGSPVAAGLQVLLSAFSMSLHSGAAAAAEDAVA